MALTAEEARAALLAIRDEGWREAAGRRVVRLPRADRRAARTFLEKEPPYRDTAFRGRFEQLVADAGAYVDGLAADRRVGLMTALHPGFGTVLAQWWVDAQRQPYITGWTRKAFRAPQHPAITRSGRCRALRETLERLGPYDRDAAWLAAWAPHIGLEHGGYTSSFAQLHAGPLLAAAIDQGGPEAEEVAATLVEIGNGEHPFGVMDRHVIVGLLRASRPDGWAFVERLLLAAQRQEGLRQTILEVADEAHPAAFDRILDLIVDQNLVRFAATVRAVTVWLGFPADVDRVPLVAERVDRLRRLRRDSDACRADLGSGEPWHAYIALCALAMVDATHALTVADELLRAPQVGVRAAAVRFVASTNLPDATARLVGMLDDTELVVAALAHREATYALRTDAPADAYENLEKLARRLPDKDRTVESIGVEPTGIVLSRGQVAASMLWARGRRPLSALLPWFGAMDVNTRWAFARALGEQQRLTPDLREVLIRMVGDRSSYVRERAVAAVDKLGVDPAEAPAIEALLTRKANDVRRAAIHLLSTQRPANSVRSAERLWATGNDAQRDAACELLRAVPGGGRRVTSAAQAFAAEGRLTERRRELLGNLLGDVAPSAPDDDPGLGLFDPARRATVPAPQRRRGVRFGSDAALRIVAALDDLAEKHRDTTLNVTSWQGTREVLLTDAQFLPSPFRPTGATDDEGHGLILPEVFRTWWTDRPAHCRHDDGLDALRALAAVAATGGEDRYHRYLHSNHPWWARLMGRLVGGNVGELRHPEVVHHALEWLVSEVPSATVVDECLDAVEATWAQVPVTVVQATPAPVEPGSRPHTIDWRDVTVGHPWSSVLRGLHVTHPSLFDPPRLGRWFQLMRWLDEPRARCTRRPVDNALLLAAHEAGVATDDDLLDHLLAPRTRLLTELTRRRRTPLERAHPGAVALADRVRDRVIDVERRRGDVATPASELATQLGSVSGADLAMELLGRLGRARLVRSPYGTGRDAVYSRLVRASHPHTDDTVATLRAAAVTWRVSDKRMVELAVYAPQWASLVEATLDWPGLETTVWWFHAHTKDDHWGVDPEVRETWAALSAERTPLTSQDLVAGAVDVDWFTRSHAALGPERWQAVDAAAKLASSGGGHRRAQLFAQARLGEIDEAALVARITGKRHQDSVRALGLLPLPADRTEREAVMLRRYAALREFERGSARFGNQRQASERAAVRVGIDNLARTAGHVDPQRFVWAMEAAEAGALADGPVAVTEGDVTVTLSVTVEGSPELSVRRGQRALKAVPAKLRKTPAIAELRDRKTALSRQSARVRASLDAAMVGQDTFTPGDLDALDRHPVVAPMLRLLVLADGRGQTMRWIDGRFVDVTGMVVAPDGGLRLAHPVDLAASGDWIAWQEQTVVDEQRQPFKQVFRELYTVTDAERQDGPASHRYEGHQIQPGQAMALFGRRGWLTDRDNRDVSRVFHKHDLVARVDFLDGFLTPAEVELPTLRAVYFTRPGDDLAQPIDDVPPILFSETMRDLDLVVSVAHAGGVDPEATASTVEMRSALVRETTRLLKLDNVRTVDSHVVIDGTLGEYSVHLGSGTVHRLPGGSVCIVPVHAQHRGRLFLPFADDDPKTAEVLTKILLLADDQQIKDPTILQQLQS